MNKKDIYFTLSFLASLISEPSCSFLMENHNGVSNMTQQDKPITDVESGIVLSF